MTQSVHVYTMNMLVELYALQTGSLIDFFLSCWALLRPCPCLCDTFPQQDQWVLSESRKKYLTISKTAGKKTCSLSNIEFTAPQ